MLRDLYNMWLAVSAALGDVWAFMSRSPLDFVCEWIAESPFAEVILINGYGFMYPDDKVTALRDLYAPYLPDVPFYLCLIGGGACILLIVKVVTWLKNSIDF